MDGELAVSWIHEVTEKQKKSFSMAVVRSQYWVRSDWSAGQGWEGFPAHSRGFHKDQLEPSLSSSCC